MSRFNCVICGYETDAPEASELGACRGNTARFLKDLHHLWKCPRCLSIHNVDPVDFADIYSDYPLNKPRPLDFYARATFGNLLKRLRRAGLTKDASILDYGCGNGAFLEYLRTQGYSRVEGHDPFVAHYAKRPESQFDCVVVNDVVEHVPDPRRTVHDCAQLVNPGGLLYVGTADSEPVDMRDLEPHVMRLHQPFHRVIVTQRSLLELGTETGFEVLASYRRSYMDTLVPISNYRVMNEFQIAIGHDLDSALMPGVVAKVLLPRPRLWFFALFGYFFPVAFEPAVVLRRAPARTRSSRLDKLLPWRRVSRRRFLSI